MSRHVALLRAVNVGGAGLLPMAHLREIAAAIGFGAPQTVLQSGNLVFENGDGSWAELEARLQLALASQAGLTADVFVRSPAAWTRLMAENPMAEAAEAAPSAFLVMVLKEPPGLQTLEKLTALAAGGERLELRGDVLYGQFPKGLGRSRLAAGLSSGRGGLVGTGRNWGTIRKIAALLAA